MTWSVQSVCAHVFCVCCCVRAVCGAGACEGDQKKAGAMTVIQRKRGQITHTDKEGGSVAHVRSEMTALTTRVFLGQTGIHTCAHT